MKRLLALGVAAIVIAGCGGNEKSAVTAVPVAAPTTTSVTNTTAPTTTSPPSSTSTTAAAQTTTLPATTTTVATEDLIKQAVQDYFEAFADCGQSPAQCEPTSFTANEGPSREKLTQLVEGMKAQGLYFSNDLRGSYLVAESVIVKSDTTATAIYCVFDALTVLGPDGPDGVPTVVNDAISSSRYTYDLFLQDGAWIVGQQQQLERLGEGSLCPAA